MAKTMFSKKQMGMLNGNNNIKVLSYFDLFDTQSILIISWDVFSFIVNIKLSYTL